MFETKQSDEILRDIKRYNMLIHFASSSLSEKVGMYNQASYVNYLEESAKERVDNLTRLRGDYEEQLNSLRSELDSAVVRGDDKEARVVLRRKERISNRLSMVNDNIDGLTRLLPEDIKSRRADILRRHAEITKELEKYQTEINTLGYSLEKYTKERVYKGKGLTSEKEEIVKVLAENIKKYIITTEKLNADEIEEVADIIVPPVEIYE